MIINSKSGDNKDTSKKGFIIAGIVLAVVVGVVLFLFTRSDDNIEDEAVSIDTLSLGESVDLGDIHVSVNSAHKDVSDDGMEMVVIDYSVENNYESDVVWSDDIITHIEQDGEELELLLIDDQDEIVIGSGESFDGVVESYVLQGDEPLYLELTETLSDEYERALFVVDFQE